MKKNNVPTRLSFLAGVLAAILASPCQAITLKEAAQEAVLKNPEVLTRWHAYKAATEEIGVIRGANRPRVDVSAGIARERQDTPTLDDSYTRSQLSLIFNQMLYDGHATRNQVTKFNHAQRVRYFELLDAAETAASEAMRAYVDVLRFLGDRVVHAVAEIADQGHDRNGGGDKQPAATATAAARGEGLTTSHGEHAVHS